MSKNLLKLIIKDPKKAERIAAGYQLSLTLVAAAREELADLEK